MSGLYEKFGLYIDGAWRRPVDGETRPVIDPAKEQSLGDAPIASAADTGLALDAARAGLAEWRGRSGWERADLLHAVADRMAARTDEAIRVISLEAGKPLAQSTREWGLSVDQFRWAAEEARRVYGRIVESRAPGGRIEVHHEPVGIVATFTAWNFPAVLIARKLAPALAAGCSVISRPSGETPGTAMIMFDCLHEAGIPAGVANLVSGPIDATYAPLMASPDVRKVSLTGSTAVGQQMIRDAADTVKRVSMELGGNAPAIVFPDADLETTLDLSVGAKFANAGQVCVAPDRFYVHEDVRDAFVDGFVERTRAIKLGYGLDDDTGMGPLINGRRRDAIEAVVADARNRGGRIETGGARPAAFNTGYFFEPTVITDVGDDALAIAEENFGPIAAITTFNDASDVYRRANSSDLGLSAYVFTRDAERAREAVGQIEAGMVGVNSYALAAAEAPFGGIKASGMGREGGTEAIHDYLNVKLAQMTV